MSEELKHDLECCGNCIYGIFDPMEPYYCSKDQSNVNPQSACNSYEYDQKNKGVRNYD